MEQEPCSSAVKSEETEQTQTIKTDPNLPAKVEDGEKYYPQYFQCAICSLKEKFDYFGCDPPYIKNYRFKENSYCIEDPFVPAKQGEYIILGTHCIKCNIMVCKDTNCSFYYDGTHCIKCAKECSKMFPKVVQDKLNRIVIQ